MDSFAHHSKWKLPRPLGAAAFVLLMCGSFTSAQQLESELATLGGAFRLTQPGDIALSPGGDQLAISDVTADRIVVLDLDFRVLWIAGEQAHLGSPRAVCFAGNGDLLFVPDQSLTVFRIGEQDPETADTVIDLSDQLPSDERITRLISAVDGGYIALCEKAGRIVRFDQGWQLESELVPGGSGQGKVLVPTGLAQFRDGRIAVSDRKNYAAQVFSSEGKFLFCGGWNEPAGGRGWTATAVAVDSRNVLWVADETDARFRLFDGSGTNTAMLPFPNPLFQPVAMVSLPDNRMFVIDATGRGAIYTLE